MKYFIATLVLVGCVIAYIHSEEPHLWNTTLMSLRVPEEGATPADDPASTNTSTAVVVPSEPAPAPKRVVPEIISPESTHLNPDHVRPVEQPGTPPATTNAGAFTAPSGTMPVGAKIPGLTPNSVPSTIKTLSGKIYTGCKLCGTVSNGISILHSEGGAKIMFTDLDPQYGSTFGYDPEAASRYEAQQASEDAAMRQQEAARAKASQPAATTPLLAETTTPAPAPSPSRLSDADRQAIMNQIASLQADVSRMQGEKARADLENQQALRMTGHIKSSGSNEGAIAAKQNQIAALQAQLRGN